MRPTRLRLTYELLEAYGVFQKPGATLVGPREAAVPELLTVHSPEYVEAVKSISRGEGRFDPARFNFYPSGDNPPYPGMYDAAVLSTGASLAAMEHVLEGKVEAAFNVSGGLHHAARDCASGFCIFNDPAIVIANLIARGLRVAYVDIDVHHGDGVQNAFYDSDRVLTISLHESGRYLFPGSGEVEEKGSGPGQGYSVNVPLAPFTDDSLYLWAFEQVVPPLLDAFQPDVLVTQMGVDAHALDPLAHLQLTTEGYAAMIRHFRQRGIPWIALGGGGYNLDVVPRVWALEFGLMWGEELPNEIPQEYGMRYGITSLRDDLPREMMESDREFAQTFAQRSVAAVQREIFLYHGL